MSTIDPDSLTAIKPELLSGEIVLWAGRPDTSVLFHREDLLLIPCSLMWGGFAVLWEAAALGLGPLIHKPAKYDVFTILWGIPFVVIGQYLIWGRFLHAAWKKRRTFYAVTNRRAIVVQDGWQRQMAFAFIDRVATLSKEGGSGRPGTLRFAAPEQASGGRRSRPAWDRMTIEDAPTFADIPDVDAVYRLVSDLHQKAASTRKSAL